MDKKLIVEIFNEHEAIIEEISRLPEIGKVIEIVNRETSGFRGARKGRTGVYRVESITPKNKMVHLRQLKTNIGESFTFFDLLTSPSVKWREIEI